MFGSILQTFIAIWEWLGEAYALGEWALLLLLLAEWPLTAILLFVFFGLGVIVMCIPFGGRVAEIIGQAGLPDMAREGLAAVAPVLAPLAVILALSAIAAAVFCFFSALRENWDPYPTFTDRHAEENNESRRAYFFGPCFHQLASTVVETFDNWKKFMDGLLTRFHNLRGAWFAEFALLLLVILVCPCVFCWGIPVCALLSAAYAAVMIPFGLAGKLLGLALFSLVRGLDWLALRLASLRSRCPNCKRVTFTPAYLCPVCGMKYQRLVPGRYGTFRRICKCGQKIPVTVFSGRSRLAALCPHCESPMASGPVRQFGIQLVGSSNAGKTTYLSAFSHLLLEKIRENGVSVRLFPEEAFRELETWFQEGLCPATDEMDAKTYSVLLNPSGKSPYQFSVYDIAGESFADSGNNVLQRQYAYCEGVIIVLDPMGGTERAADCVSGFTAELRRIRQNGMESMHDIPAAVLIAKGDLFKREIGLPLIRVRANAIRENARNMEDKATLEQARTELCREFLTKHGFQSALNILEGEFSRIAFFPVSAMGNLAEAGKTYDPWGVMEPVEWILERAGQAGAELKRAAGL